MSGTQARIADIGGLRPGPSPRHWRTGLLAGLTWLGVLGGIAPVAAQTAQPLPSLHALDQERSAFSFALRTRWGVSINGRFAQFEGGVETLPDGRHRVRVRLAAGAVEVAGPSRYTQLARGPELFDAARYPWIEFVSTPYDHRLPIEGGELVGQLSMHGISREERFVVEPSRCVHPGVDCDVHAQGSVSRDAYGLDGWRWMLGDRVQFLMRVRLDEPSS